MPARQAANRAAPAPWMVVDLTRSMLFEELHLQGDFSPGDIVMPMVAGKLGGLVPPELVHVSEDSRGVSVEVRCSTCHSRDSSGCWTCMLCSVIWVVGRGFMGR